MHWTDRSFLRQEAYRQPDKLAARQALHQHYNQNPEPWFSWVFDRLDLQPGLRILDVGCGPADLWRHNLDRLPPDLSVTLADLSQGMAARAAATLPAASGRTHFSFLSADIQRLPFEDARFDLVIANHMLYHVPDLPAGLQEIRRILAPGGRLCATANGRGHMIELSLLAGQPLGQTVMEAMVERFGLEVAPSVLSPCFTAVQIEPYPDGMWVTEAEPLVAYVESMFHSGEAHPDHDTVRSQVEARIQIEGGYRVTKASGIIRAVRI